MNSKNSSTRNMYQILINLLILFDLVWSVIPSVNSIVLLFQNKVGEIDDTAAKQQGSLKAYKVNKIKKKRKMADMALVMRGKLSAFSATSGNNILLVLMRISFSKLFYARDAICVAYAEKIYKAAYDLIPSQRTAAGISDQDVLDLQATIDEFKALPNPIEMRVAKKQLTELLDNLFKEGNAILTDSLDGLMEQFKLNHTELYERWFNSRRMLETHRHTTIEMETIDSITGEDLSDVQVLITSDDDNFQEMTDIQGFAKQQIAPETNYKVKFILPEYDPVEYEKINLNRGKHQRLIVKLKKSEA